MLLITLSQNRNENKMFFRNGLHGLYLYKTPHKYTECMSTHYVESFNNVVLVYIDKRIHFRNTMYLIKIGLSILDWNENVDRPATSVRHYMEAGMDMNRQGKRVLTAKTFRFVAEIWEESLEVLNQDNVVDRYHDEDVEEEENGANRT